MTDLTALTAEQILTKELDEPGQRIVGRLRELREEKRAIEALEKQAVEEFKAHMGLASVATVGGEPVASVSLVFRESFDVAKARQDPVYAEMVRACTTASSYSTVRLV
jgi:hypothetical protein